MVEKGKVLIVDDDPAVLRSTALMVEAFGYDAVTLDDPGEILETVERHQPGIILQDLRMPDLNVAGLVAALRSNPATEEVPLVFFSASGELPTTAARYDAWGYLPKPFTPEELSGLLERVLGPSSPQMRQWEVRDIRREVRSAFDDHINLLAALSSRIKRLEEEATGDERTQRVVDGLKDTLDRLESHTERLHVYIRTLIESLEQGKTVRHRVGRREVRSIFHDHWNVLSALNSYIQVLDRTPGAGTKNAQAVRGLNDTLLRLESKTDRLHAYLQSLIESIGPGMQPAESRPGPSTGK